MEEATSSGEKEEEEAFLISLYKFMKDRHTPIERIPHLGFKQSTFPRGWRSHRCLPHAPLTLASPLYSQLTSGRSTKPWRSWEPMSW